MFYGVCCSLLNSNVFFLVIYVDIKIVVSIVEKYIICIDKEVGYICIFKEEKYIILKYYYFSFIYLIFLWEMWKINFFFLNCVDLDYNLYC